MIFDIEDGLLPIMAFIKPHDGNEFMHYVTRVDTETREVTRYKFRSSCVKDGHSVNRVEVDDNGALVKETVVVQGLNIQIDEAAPDWIKVKYGDVVNNLEPRPVWR